MCRLGASSPRNPHARDAAAAGTFSDESIPNAHTLCGALVSGPHSTSGGTDLYEDSRDDWRASEAGIDYSASVICAFGGYAALPHGAFGHCDARSRSPLDGRV